MILNIPSFLKLVKSKREKKSLQITTSVFVDVASDNFCSVNWPMPPYTGIIYKKNGGSIIDLVKRLINFERLIPFPRPIFRNYKQFRKQDRKRERIFTHVFARSRL
jgi:hypothetical protein